MTNTETAKATARPWAVMDGSHEGFDGEWDVIGHDGSGVASMAGNCDENEKHANARLIVKAVNHHDELVEALIYVRDNLVRDPFDNATEPNADVIDRVCDALAKACQ